jgi:hypothetical protein
MEAKCDGCTNEYNAASLKVMQDGTFWCADCHKAGLIPKTVAPILIPYNFTYAELNTLCKFLDGDMDVDTLMDIEDIKWQLNYRLIRLLKRVVRREDIPESYR